MSTVSAILIEHFVLCGITVQAAALEQGQGDFLL